MFVIKNFKGHYYCGQDLFGQPKFYASVKSAQKMEWLNMIFIFKSLNDMSVANGPDPRDREFPYRDLRWVFLAGYPYSLSDNQPLENIDQLINSGNNVIKAIKNKNK